jgi:hypothetical protein
MKGDKTPDWPQPQGVFELGTKFNPSNFLAVLHDVYAKLVVQGHTGNNVAMEYLAFGRLLQERLIVVADGRHLFKLFALELPSSTPPDLIVDHDGTRCMRVDYLREAE